MDNKKKADLNAMYGSSVMGCEYVIVRLAEHAGVVAELLREYYDSKCSRAVYSRLWKRFKAGAVSFDEWEEFYRIAGGHWECDELGFVYERRAIACDDIRQPLRYRKLYVLLVEGSDDD